MSDDEVLDVALGLARQLKAALPVRKDNYSSFRFLARKVLMQKLPAFYTGKLPAMNVMFSVFDDLAYSQPGGAPVVVKP